MGRFKHSEVAAKLAIEGAVAAIGGTVKGHLGITPRALSRTERIDLGMSTDGDALYYPVGDTGVFFHTDGARTTIWYGGADYEKGIDALDALIRRNYPEAKKVKDGAHDTDPEFNLRTYDIKLPNNHLAIVDAIYTGKRAQKPNFMTRITAMARQN